MSQDAEHKQMQVAEATEHKQARSNETAGGKKARSDEATSVPKQPRSNEAAGGKQPQVGEATEHKQARSDEVASVPKQPLTTKDLSASQIEVIYKATDRLYAKFAHRCGISDSAYWVLYAIVFSEEPVTQGILADVWSYSKQTVNSAVHTLQEKGLVTLDFAPGSKKSKYITLTEQGKEFSRIYLEPAMKAEERAFATMTLQERAELIRLIDKYTTAIDAEINQISLALED